MRGKIIRFSKRRSLQGFTLVETLVTVVILVMVSSFLAIGIPISIKAYKSITQNSVSNTLVTTLQFAITDELRYAENIQQKNGIYYWHSEKHKTNVCAKIDETGKLIFEAAQNGAPVIFKPLDDAAYADTLSARISLTYDSSTKIFHAMLTIFDTADGTEYSFITFAVRNI
ncbi:MAG: type II secretion system protein [Clostridia bacterium]